MIPEVIIGLNVIISIAALVWFFYVNYKNEIKRGVWEKIGLFFTAIWMFVFGVPVLVCLGAIVAFTGTALYLGCCAIFGEEAFENFLMYTFALIIGGFAAFIVLWSAFSLLLLLLGS